MEVEIKKLGTGTRKRLKGCPFWANLNNICVKPASRFDIRPDGIAVPTAGEYFVRGEVVALGEGQIDDHSTRMPMHVELGDKVILPNPCGVPADGYILLNEVNVLAIEERTSDSVPGAVRDNLIQLPKK